jgi:hypothetical protein
MSRLAQRLIDHAVSVMPEHRREWAEAMRAELEALPTDREALTWATGCVWASYCERTKLMQIVLKSLLRAVAEGLLVAAFILGLMNLSSLWVAHSQHSCFQVMPDHLAVALQHASGGASVSLPCRASAYVGGLLIVLLGYSGGVFATLCILELVIARFPGKPFMKTLLRASVLGLWPVGWEVSLMIVAWRVPIVHNTLVHFGSNFFSFMSQGLIRWAGDFLVYSAAMLVPLLICELLFGRFWSPRSNVPA